MKKFSKIVESEDKEKTLDFKGDKSNTTSDDVENLNDLMDDNLSDEIKASIVDGEWEIESIVDNKLFNSFFLSSIIWIFTKLFFSLFFITFSFSL
jgi:hypothetical protein